MKLAADVFQTCGPTRGNMSLANLSHYRKKLPERFTYILERLGRAIIEEQPENMYAFAAAFMDKMIVEREADVKLLPKFTYLQSLNSKRKRASYSVTGGSRLDNGNRESCVEVTKSTADKLENKQQHLSRGAIVAKEMENKDKTQQHTQVDQQMFKGKNDTTDISPAENIIILDECAQTVENTESVTNITSPIEIHIVEPSTIELNQECSEILHPVPSVPEEDKTSINKEVSTELITLEKVQVVPTKTETDVTVPTVGKGIQQTTSKIDECALTIENTESVAHISSPVEIHIVGPSTIQLNQECSEICNPTPLVSEEDETSINGEASVDLSTSETVHVVHTTTETDETVPTVCKSIQQTTSKMDECALIEKHQCIANCISSPVEIHIVEPSTIQLNQECSEICNPTPLVSEEDETSINGEASVDLSTSETVHVVHTTTETDETVPTVCKSIQQTTSKMDECALIEKHQCIANCISSPVEIHIVEPSTIQLNQEFSEICNPKISVSEEVQTSINEEASSELIKTEIVQAVFETTETDIAVLAVSESIHQRVSELQIEDLDSHVKESQVGRKSESGAVANEHASIKSSRLQQKKVSKEELKETNSEFCPEYQTSSIAFPTTDLLKALAYTQSELARLEDLHEQKKSFEEEASIDNEVCPEYQASSLLLSTSTTATIDYKNLEESSHDKQKHRDQPMKEVTQELEPKLTNIAPSVIMHTLEEQRETNNTIKKEQNVAIALTHTSQIYNVQKSDHVQPSAAEQQASNEIVETEILQETMKSDKKKHKKRKDQPIKQVNHEPKTMSTNIAPSIIMHSPKEQREANNTTEQEQKVAIEITPTPPIYNLQKSDNVLHADTSAAEKQASKEIAETEILQETMKGDAKLSLEGESVEKQVGPTHIKQPEVVISISATTTLDQTASAAPSNIHIEAEPVNQSSQLNNEQSLEVADSTVVIPYPVETAEAESQTDPELDQHTEQQLNDNGKPAVIASTLDSTASNSTSNKIELSSLKLGFQKSVHLSNTTQNNNNNGSRHSEKLQDACTEQLTSGQLMKHVTDKECKSVEELLISNNNAEPFDRELKQDVETFNESIDQGNGSVFKDSKENEQLVPTTSLLNDDSTMGEMELQQRNDGNSLSLQFETDASANA